MAIEVLEVAKGSVAEKAGIHAGDLLLRINGEDLVDEIDYQALTQSGRLSVLVRSPAGVSRTLHVSKKTWEPMGLTLDEREILKPRVCANRCVFCFVDQLPPGMRESLYVRDDDWRLSLMMGNFVTLTNVNDREFDRILRRKASPLYISVHATDPDVRVRLLRNPGAGNILDRLRAMKEHGLHFHGQVVCCPGLNDGPVLHQTIVDLAALHPAALSLAVVPVGLTAHREGLPSVRLFTRDEARALIHDLELIQAYYLRTIGTRFVYAADEFYTIAGMPLPSEEAYEDYPQIENGVGMLRRMAQECEEFYPEIQEHFSGMPERKRHVLIPTGVSACSFIRELSERYAPKGTEITVIPVENAFFGKTVTVTGLIVGEDLIHAVRGIPADVILISESMLRENTDSFLDNRTLREIQDELGVPCRSVENTGEAFLRALYEWEE